MTNAKEPKQTAHTTENGRLVSESLRLSCTSLGPTTSSSIAERSVQWHENRLEERKSDLDQRLHKSIVKINSGRLEVQEELARMKKSSSTGNLDSLARKTNGLVLPHQKGHQQVKSPGNTSSTPQLRHKRRQSSGAITGLPGPPSHGANSTKERPKVSIIVGSEDNDSDNSDPDKPPHTDKSHKTLAQRTLSVTSCQLGRECSSARSELNKFENTTKRYTKELNGKTKHGK